MRPKTKFQSIKVLGTIVLAFLGYCATGKADVTAASWADDGDGAIVCQSWWFNQNTSALTMVGDQYWGPGHMVGTITASVAQDPTLFLGSGVDNDSGSAWGSYVVNVIMNQSFTFVSGSESVSNPESDWFVANVAQPVLQSGGIYNGLYEGTIDLAGGTPVQVGDELDFSYAIKFTGSTDYSFTQEMIPVAVPEPSEIGLLTLSAFLFGGLNARIRSFCRKA